MEHFVHFLMAARGVRRLGSAAMDLCYVAAGRFDGFWEVSLSPWDMAAGALLHPGGGRPHHRHDRCTAEHLPEERSWQATAPSMTPCSPSSIRSDLAPSPARFGGREMEHVILQEFDPPFLLTSPPPATDPGATASRAGSHRPPQADDGSSPSSSCAGTIRSSHRQAR